MKIECLQRALQAFIFRQLIAGHPVVRKLRGTAWEEQNVVTVNQQKNCKVNLWEFFSKENSQVFLSTTTMIVKCRNKI